LNKLVKRNGWSNGRCFDIEMILEVGYCSGIENYPFFCPVDSRPNRRPPCLTICRLMRGYYDESHVTVPQIGAMYKGDRSRRNTG